MFQDVLSVSRRSILVTCMSSVKKVGIKIEFTLETYLGLFLEYVLMISLVFVKLFGKNLH